MTLAVPFFFMLSSFVLCHAYAGMPFTRRAIQRFAAHRLVRLMPMLVPASVIGCTLLSYRLHQGNLEADLASSVLVAQVLSFSTLPTPFLAIDNWRWPVNPPEWSLFFEFVGSGLVGAALLWMSVKRLAVVAGAAFAVLVMLAVRGGVLGAGLLGQLALTTFCFTAGRLIHAAYLDARPATRLGRTVAAVALTVLLFMPWLLPWPLQAAVLLVGLPALIWVSTIDLHRPGMPLLCHWLGELSYPVYILHFPILGWLRQLAPGMNEGATIASTLVLVYVASWALLLCYDHPLRRRLRAASRGQLERDRSVMTLQDN